MTDRRPPENDDDNSGAGSGSRPEASFFKRILRGISNAFFPEGIKCISCGDELPADDDYCLCKKCRKDFPFTTENICLKCGVALQNMSEFCQTCKFTEREFALARAPVLYRSAAAKLVKDYKAGDKFLAPYFARMMADYYVRELKPYGIDAVTFVPSDKIKTKSRGYNQSQVLSELFCKETGLPLLPDALAEVRTTRKQALLPAAERAKNVEGAYAVTGGFDKTRLKKKNILLIDDIFTTGSTANECAKVLKKAGTKAVYVLTLATGEGK